MSDTKTTVVKEEVTSDELNALLEIPGADSVLLPGEVERPGFFSKGEVDLSFITTRKEPVKKVVATGKVDPDPDKIDPKVEPDAAVIVVDEIIKDVDPDPDKPVTDDTKGRPKVVKDAAVELTKKLIEKKVLVPFDDEKAVEDYTVADFEELFEANMKDKEERIRQEVPVEFFDSLSPELQYAAKYEADGGKDIKGLFKALGEVQEVKELSAEDPKDHETIVREYLSVTNFGTPEDITEEINSWKDLNKLDEKAQKFKPKLDLLREEQVSSRLARQEAETKRRQEASQAYANSVYETLKPSEINGLKLDKKTQGMLYSGLIQPQYPSISGKSTNLLGHLLEKYQFVEPNHALIAEALWLLSDPEGYRSKVKEQAKTDVTEAIVRKLKTEEAKKTGSSSTTEKDSDNRGERKIQRTNNFFKR